jgi:hypothetical protein
MNMKRKLYLMLTLTLLSMASMTAQVTIGSQTAPEKGALLQLRQRVPAQDETFDNADKGLLFPRVALVAYDSLDPLYGVDGATPEEAVRATGMVVYNTNADAEGLEQGLYVWKENEWIGISSKQSEASFSVVQCENITVCGTYTQGVPVEDDTHYMEIALLNVERPGAYVISASTGNGYSFYKSGALLDKGPTTLKVPAQGTPRVGGNTYKDILTIEGLPIDGSCSYEIPVAEGTFDVITTFNAATGSYFLNKPLTAANTLQVTVRISKTKNNDPLHNNITLAAATTHGISVEPWHGNLIAGQENEIVLQITGTPDISESFDIPLILTIDGSTYLLANKNYSAQARIPMELPHVKYSIFANYDYYSWNTTQRREALNSSSNFSRTGTVKVKSNTLLPGWHFSSITKATEKLKAEMDKYGIDPASATLPDYIVFYAYNVYGADASNVATQLARYVNAGGVLIYAPNDFGASDASDLLSKIYPSASYAATNISGGFSSFRINTIANDPVIHGPFFHSGLGGKYWSEHNAGTVSTQIPPSAVEICAASSSSDHLTESGSVVWYDTVKNFFYFGDSTGSATTAQNTTNGEPAHYSNSNLNYIPLYGAISASQPIAYNAILEMNAVNWAIQRALAGGINH